MPDRQPGFVQHTAISVGAGLIETLGDQIRRLGGDRPVILIDAALEQGPVGNRLRTLLPHAPLLGRTSQEPSFESVAQDAQLIGESGADLLVAVGGGSTIDSAKLLRGLLAAGVESLAELPESFGSPPMPLIAAPTTAGTGAEIGAGAIVFDSAIGDKILIRRRELAANVAIADGELTLGLPPHLTAWTGCDALGQAILAFVPAGWDALSGQIALRAISLIANALPQAVADGSNKAARNDQMLGSVLSALAMYNAPPDYAGEHLFAEPVGAALGVHHGLAVAAFLAGTAEYNAEVLAQPYAAIARVVGAAQPDDPDSTASLALVEWLRSFVRKLGVPGLAQIAGAADARSLAKRCALHDGYVLNPRPLSEESAVRIIRGALDGSFSATGRGKSDVPDTSHG